jgi:Tfp pilus assembly protein PilZ
MSSEKRKHPRVPKQLRLEFRKSKFFFLKGPVESAEMVDLSRGGVRLNTRADLKKGEYITLLVPVRAHPSGVEFAGHVMWMRRMLKDGVSFTQVGVAFEPLSRDQSILVFRLATASSGL